MILVLAVLGVIWGLRALGKLGYGAALFASGAWMALVLFTHALFPPDHPLPQMFGGSLRGWMTVTLIGALAAGYSIFIGAMRAGAAAKTPQTPADTGSFSESELDRYARHIIMHEIGGAGQKSLKQARVLVIGAGGLGSPALLYLAAAGVGTIGVIDDDVVDNSNLQRQVIHRDADIGVPKVFSAAKAMIAQNPHITVKPYNRRLREEDAEAIFAGYDLILEGTDNFETRYLANRIAAKLKIPMIGAALTQWEGQISLYDPAKGGPCYQCVFPVPPADGLAPSCAEAGVAGPLPGVVGSMMAVEAVKTLVGAGAGLAGRVMLYDALYAQMRIITAKKREDCPVCGTGN